MAYGTESVPKVNKIFGPGNSFVTMAKQLVAQQCNGLAIDMPAGPSEVLVIADMERMLISLRLICFLKQSMVLILKWCWFLIVKS